MPQARSKAPITAPSDSEDEKREREEREAADAEAERHRVEAEEAERTAAQEAQRKAGAGVETHTREALIEAARSRFNCSPHAVVGALAGEQDEFTDAEAADRIEDFLTREHE